MNKIYKVIWSKVKHQYVVTSEFAHSCTKSTTSRVGKTALAALAAFVLTAGVGGVQAVDATAVDQEEILSIQMSSGNDSKAPVNVSVPSENTATEDTTEQPSDENPQSTESVVTTRGFFVDNGQGTQNSLTKDGLWVGGTSNETGFFVDNDGNMRTTGNAKVVGTLTAANDTFAVSESGGLSYEGNSSSLKVNDGSASLTNADSSVMLMDGAAMLQSGGANGSRFTVSKDGATFENRNNGTTTTISGNQITTGSITAADAMGSVKIEHGAITTTGNAQSTIGGVKLQNGKVTADNVMANDSIQVGDSINPLETTRIDGGSISTGELRVAGSNFIVDKNGNVTTEGTLSAADGKFMVDEKGFVTADTITAVNSGSIGGINMMNHNIYMYDFADPTKLIFHLDEAGNIETAGNVTVNNEDGFASVILGTDGGIIAGNNRNFQVTSDGVLSVGNGKFTVSQYGVVEANNIISKEMYVGSQEAENRVVTKGQLDKVSSDLSDVSEDLANVNNDLTAYEDAGIIAGDVAEGAKGAIAIGEGAAAINGNSIPDGAIAIGRKATVSMNGAIAIGDGANAVGQNSVALGTGASTTNGGWNSVAIGWASQATDDFVVSVGSDEYKRRIVNVADGTDPTDAVNKRQLDAVTTTVSGVSEDLTAYESAGVVAGQIGNETFTSNAIALGEGVNVTGDGVIAIAGEQTLANGNDVIAIGNNSQITSSNNIGIGNHLWNAGKQNTVIIGNYGKAAAENAVVLGGNGKVSEDATNSVALGADSVATEENVVSVGHKALDVGGNAISGAYSEDLNRRIVNVADGINATDAATVGQMNTIIFGSTSDNKSGLSDGTLTNKAKSLVEGINKNSAAINRLSDDLYERDTGFDWGTIQDATNSITTMQAKMANFEAALSNLNDNTLPEASPLTTGENYGDGREDHSGNGGTGVVNDKGGNGFVANDNGTNTVTGDTTFNNDVTVKEDLTVEGNAVFKNGADMNGHQITNVGEGKVEAGSKDVVTGNQLWNVKQDVAANSQAINTLGHQVSDLGDEIDSVGAISAALAGLHPLDYDGTGSKFQISAAMGTYDGTQAAAIGGFYHFNRDVMMSLGGATSFEGSKKTAANIGVTFRVGEGASGKSVSDDVMARLEAMDQKIAALEQENKELKNVLGAIDTSLSKEFPDVPANHWAYEAVTKLAGNDVVAGYPDGEFHGDRTMTRYEMAEIIYKAMNRGVQVDQKLVEEFKPEMEQVAANETTQAAPAESTQTGEENA